MSTKDRTSSSTTDRHLNGHEDGCFKGWIIGASLASQRLRSLPAYKGAWDCEGCMPGRFGKKVAHIPTLTKELCLVSQTHTQRAATRQRANRGGYGYITVTLGDGTYMCAGPPELYPTHEPKPVTEALERLFEIVKENGLKRISFSQSWKPEPVPRYYSFPTYEKDRTQVRKALKEMGYEEGDRIQGSLDHFKRDLLEKLGHEEVGFFT